MLGPRLKQLLCLTPMRGCREASCSHKVTEAVYLLPVLPRVFTLALTWPSEAADCALIMATLLALVRDKRLHLASGDDFARGTLPAGAKQGLLPGEGPGVLLRAALHQRSSVRRGSGERGPALA